MSKFAFIVRCLLVVTGIVSTTATARTEEKPHPDIVFIIVDDLNDWVGCLGGHPDAKSPNIDALAASGMLFSQAYCNSPQCRPSRTSLNYGDLSLQDRYLLQRQVPQRNKNHDAHHAAVLHGHAVIASPAGAKFSTALPARWAMRFSGGPEIPSPRREKTTSMP